MNNYQHQMFMNPKLGNQQGFSQQQGLGFGPEGMSQSMNILHSGFPGGALPNAGEGGYPYPVQQHMMEDDQAVMSTAFNPHGPEMAQQMTAPHGPHGPGCTCGHHHGPMGGHGMMGGFNPHGHHTAPGMMGGFGPGGPGVGPMGGFGPGGPGMMPPQGPGMMSPQGLGMMSPQGLGMRFGPHGPGCSCGHHQGPMGEFGPGIDR